jgi:hypothetical protein
MFKIIFVKEGKFTLETLGSMTFDDWIGGTFQGLIFATTVYSAQDQIPFNLKRIV